MKLSTSTRINVKALANIATWLISEGKRPPNRSALINAAVESLSLSLHDAGKGTLFDSDEAALKYLASEGYDWSDGTSKRAQREVVVSLADESLRAARNEEQEIEEAMRLFEEGQQLKKAALPENPTLDGRKR